MSAWDVAALSVVLAGASLYAVGLARLPSRRWATSAAVACSLGWLALVAAFAPPLGPHADLLFAAHMGQHELLILVAPALLVVGRPLLVALWALPRRLRVAIAAMARRPAVAAAWRRVTAPLVVLLLHGIALWVWHLPVAFEAALADEALHAFQHLTFFATAALFWWALVRGRFGRLGYGAGVLFVFATALHSGALGALLTMAPRPLYATHAARAAAAGTAPLADQQLAGLLMWVPASVVFLLAALGLFVAWLGQVERRGRHARRL
jgi:putative membrane protein